MWKLYDMAAGWSMSTTPPYVLDPAKIPWMVSWYTRRKEHKNTAREGGWKESDSS